MPPAAPAAADELVPLVYDELRRLARARMAREAPGHTLQPTALVHEAYLRLAGDAASPPFASRAQFFAAAAEAMRRILIERARRVRRLKRGGGRLRVTLADDLADAPARDAELLALDQALTRLEARDAAMARVVALRCFAGLTVEESAAALEVSERTVKRLWTAGRAWLHRELTRPASAAPAAGDASPDPPSAGAQPPPRRAGEGEDQ